MPRSRFSRFKKAVRKSLLPFRSSRHALARPLVFITGAPRSGTSFITKVIDSHPDVAVLMENIFGNRRRHWQRAEFWKSSNQLRRAVSEVYARLNHSIVGNKVCTPDVWSAQDIHMFCSLFSTFKIIFVVRNPVNVALSRYKHENEETESQFNQKAKENILLNFQTRFHTYVSSWRQSIEVYWRLLDAHPGKVLVVYYEDFCAQFEEQTRRICEFLQIPFSTRMLQWNEFVHHDAMGRLKRDLKYPDQGEYKTDRSNKQLPQELVEALSTIQWQCERWQNRAL